MSAALGLGLYACWLVAAFGLRAWAQRRRTGDSGWRGLSGQPGSARWWAGVLFAVALLGGLAAPVADLTGALQPLPGLAGNPTAAVGVAIAALGLVATFAAQASIGDQWRVGVDASERTTLVVSGAFRFARNPFFTSTVILATGVALCAPNVLAAVAWVCLVAAVQLQVRVVEEPYLRRTHPSYAEYAASVGRFLPGIGTSPATPAPHGHDHGGHSDHGGHGGHGGSGRSFEARQRRLAFATGLNVAIVAGQVVAGLVVGSVALLADAGHNLSDAAGVAFALVALRLARRAPSATRTFGGLRWPVLAAQANAAAVLVVTAVLTVEALTRLAEPTAVDGLAVAAVALVAAAGNALSALVVHERHGDLNNRAAVLHLGADAAVSVAVAIAGLAIWLVGGWYWLDPAASLAVSLLIGVQGVRLLAQSSRVLLEATPRNIDMTALRADVLAVEGVTGVHDVHVWGLSDQVSAASAHVEVEGHPSLEEARAVADRVKLVLAERHGVAHATLEAECEPCGPAERDPCEVTRIEHGQPAHSHSHH